MDHVRQDIQERLGSHQYRCIHQFHEVLEVLECRAHHGILADQLVPRILGRPNKNMVIKDVAKEL